jgi:signal transduction histidine kinase
VPDRDRSPRRFRRRLTAAFVVVAALSAGLVAAVTVVLTRESRWRGFRATSLDEARFALAVAPATLTAEEFERFLAVYERRSEANILIVDDRASFASSLDLTSDDIPDDLADPTDQPALVEATVDGRAMLVAGAADPHGVKYYLFFSLDQLRQSLNELTRAAAISWLATTVLAGAVGSVVARRTLRPVAQAAEAAEAMAAGDLTTRLPHGATDEFGILATSFNHMADEVETLVGRLADAAARERRFTADVAHELRTPLTGMSAAASLLSADLAHLPRSSRRPAAILVHDIERLRTLIVELLELATLDSSPESHTPVSLDVRAAIDSLTTAPPPREPLDVTVDVEPHLRVLADPSGLRRILGNLLDNARTHGNGANIRISGYRCGDDVCIDVTDDGPGISPSDIDRVFDRLYKTDTSRSASGFGLGLAIAREHAQRQGGSLSVTSLLHRGARFTLRLPVAEP